MKKNTNTKKNKNINKNVQGKKSKSYCAKDIFIIILVTIISCISFFEMVSGNRIWYLLYFIFDVLCVLIVASIIIKKNISWLFDKLSYYVWTIIIIYQFGYLLISYFEQNKHCPVGNIKWIIVAIICVITIITLILLVKDKFHKYFIIELCSIVFLSVIISVSLANILLAVNSSIDVKETTQIEVLVTNKGVVTSNKGGHHYTIDVDMNKNMEFEVNKSLYDKIKQDKNILITKHTGIFHIEWYEMMKIN